MNVKTKKEIVIFFKYLSRLGVLRGLSMYWDLRFGKKESIQIPGIPHSVNLRKGTSDIAVFYQIFIKQQYSFKMPADIKTIIDCGANIGLASIFFATKFPSAKIIAVEPESSNFQMLKKNCAPYKNIVALQKAIWFKSGTLQLQDPGLGHYGFTTIESESISNGGVDAVSIDDLVEQYRLNEIDLLKIDIEGAEKELFGSNFDGWLPKTKLIAIEVHDHLRDGISRTLIKALAKYDFSMGSFGEGFVCERNDKRAS